MAHDLRAIVRLALGREEDPTAAICDSRTVQSTPESGGRAGDDGYKRRKGSKVHIAADTLGDLLARTVTPANEQDRAQVGALSAAVQEATGEKVEVAFVDQGDTGEKPTGEARRPWSAARSRQARGSQTRFCAATQAMGGRALLAQVIDFRAEPTQLTLLCALDRKSFWMAQCLAGLGVLDPLAQRPGRDAQIAGDSALAGSLEHEGDSIFL